MTDRVPQYPGRVKLVPVSGQTNTFDMTMADEPTQEGTPLNKGTLLSDETAAALGLTGDPTVDEGLAKVAGELFHIGDTLTTMRTDLGDKWLLCNGEGASAESYPALADLAHANGMLLGINTKTELPVSSFQSSWYDSGSNTFAVLSAQTIYYTTLPFGSASWSSITLPTSTTWTAKKLKVVNGRWMCLGGTNDKNSGVLCNTANIDIASAWSKHYVDENNQYEPNDIVYANGIYAVCASNMLSTKTQWAGRIYTSNNLADWTVRTTSSSSYYVRMNCIYYLNGYFIAGGRDYSKYSTAHTAFYTYSSNGTSWSSNSPQTAEGIVSMAYANGLWVFGTSSGVLTLSSLSAQFSVINPTPTRDCSGMLALPDNPSKLFICGGHYVSFFDLSTMQFTTPQDLGADFVDGGTLFLQDNVFSVVQSSPGTQIYDTAHFSVPNVSTSGLYTYIRAKE